MSPTARDRHSLLLLALVTVIVAELVRASGPLLDHAFAAGVTTAALAALATYLAPAVLVAALTAGRPVSGRTVLVAVSLLVAARVGLQALGARIAAVPPAPGLGELRFYGGLGTVALGFATLVLVAAFASGTSAEPADDGAPPPGPGSLVARGVTLGLLGAAAVAVLQGTWDAVWRSDAASWAVTGLLGAGALVVAVRLRRRGHRPGARGLWLLGSFLALGVQAFANPAFVASTTGLPLAAASGATAVAALGVGVALSVHRPAVGPWAAAVTFVGGTWLLFLTVPLLADPAPVWSWALLVVATALPAAGARTLAAAWSRPTRVLRGRRLVGVTAAAGLGAALPLLVYQLHFEVPLPVPAGLVPVVAAAVVALPALVGSRRLARLAPTAGPLLTGAVALLAAAGTVTALATGPGAERGPAQDVADDDALTVLSWNVHYGVGPGPSVRLGEMADVVEDSEADVVALQEVSRGWVLGGGADMLSFLADATGMEHAFVPAADRRFGNALLWDPERVTASDVDRVALPFGDGPQDRSALAATFRPAGGGTTADGVRVVATHLQHREENRTTRLEQLDALFDAEPVDGPYVLAGDLNAEPGWPEITALEERGLVSGQDAVGDPAALTSPAVDPRYRVDWVLASEDLTFTAFEVLDVTTSDHRPLVATVAPAG
ncbi:endonuclease/exonuclease/phosphatase family protein [Isoptericola sp. AK164]|uniref:endonuclease/exonuclease/phosphatase family protein n=1 Tax=Isoptericola sp. AK164 TaxID=3024246 RepID=UPI0024186213|nr:endonuclease/exonuclease/phosphatase family protein [Isoptericola sp. AK164]